MTEILVNVRAALDALSHAARPPLATLHHSIVAHCLGDEEPQFGATARLLEAVVALEKAIAADIPHLIDEAEVALGNAARTRSAKSTNDSV